MKVRFFSDLHLDFCHERTEEGDEDVVILLGDAMEGEGGVHWLADCFSTKKKIFVPGNHEFYRGEFYAVAERIMAAGNERDVMVLFLGEATIIDGVMFAGGTLWTDPPGIQARGVVGSVMSDFRGAISFNGRRMTVDDAVSLHRRTLKSIELSLRHADACGIDKVVVCSHHAPSYGSVAEKYRAEHGTTEDLMNYGWYTELEPFIRKHSAIKHWLHGHTHSGFDYQIGDCRIQCNPRGYTRVPRWTPENPSFDWHRSFVI